MADIADENPGKTESDVAGDDSVCDGYRRTDDVFGLPVTLSPGADVAVAMEHFNMAAEAYANYSNPMDALEKALAADPDLFMAHLVKAAFLGRTNLDRSEPKDGDNPDEVMKRALSAHLNSRERQYGAAHQKWCTGDFESALTAFEELSLSYPTDLIVLRLLHALYLILGLPRRMRNSLMGVAYAWKESMTFFPLFLGMYSFALEECHEYEFAREKALRALRMRPDSVWAIHALAHCHEERSPAHSGIAFLEGSQSNWHDSILSGHIAWHLALQHFDAGNVDRALEIFDTDLVERMATGVIYSLVDAASLLWRMECCGVSVGAHRWQKIIGLFKNQIGEHQMAWFDIHLMYALTHDAEPEQASKLLLARQLLQSMETYMTCHEGHNTTVMRRFGYQACQGLLAYATGNFEEACKTLLEIQPNELGCGWSTAQRQVFLIQLYHVAQKANNAKVANSALSTLKEMKPYSLLISRLKFL